VLLGFAAARRARGLPTRVFTWPLFADTPLVPAFLMMLAVALLAAAIGLAAIIGAFVAGLIVAETEAVDEIERDFRPLASIFTPFFFAVTGAQLDLSPLRDPTILVFAVALGAIGVVTKALGGILERGRATGVFRGGVDPLQLYISIAGIAYFYLSNQHTLSTIFGRDLMSPKALNERLSHICDVILGYVLRE
jgi:hypothetical protein